MMSCVTSILVSCIKLYMIEFICGCVRIPLCLVWVGAIWRFEDVMSSESTIFSSAEIFGSFGFVC